MRRFCFFLAIIASLSCRISNSAAGTEVGGGIDFDTTWSMTGSPYIVTSSTTLMSGVTLTVEAGVEIRFRPGVPMVINGTISAVGSASQPIRFTSDEITPAAGDWNGIHFRVGSSDSALEWCILEYAVTSVTVFAYYSEQVTPEFSNCVMRLNSQNGIHVESMPRGCQSAYAGPTVEGCIVESNGSDGIFYDAHGHGSIGCAPRSQGKIGGSIRNCLVRYNGDQGLRLLTDAGHDTSGEIYTTLDGNTIFENGGSGVEVSGDTSNRPRIINNLIFGNAKTGIHFNAYVSGVFRMSMSNNTVYGNTENGVYLGGNSLESIYFTNNIIAENGGYGLVMTPGETLFVRGNNDLWSNGAGEYLDTTPAAGDISAPPLFADAQNGDFHLLAESPCIDAGNTTTAATTDVDGEQRPAYDGFDIGADEFATVIGDIDRDRRLDLSDLITVLRICTGLSVSTDIHMDAEPVVDSRIDLMDGLHILGEMAR